MQYHRRWPPLARIFLLVFLDLLSYGLMIPLLPFFVQRYDGGAAAAGALGSAYALMQLFSGPVLGALSDKYGRRPILLACLLGTALAYLILGLANSLALVFLAIALDGLTGGNLTTAYAYIADITTPENRSRGMGLVGAAFGLGLMIGPALGGWLSQFGLTVPALVACGLAVGNTAFGLLALPESLPPSGRAAQLTWHTLNSFVQLQNLWHLVPVRLLLAALFTLNLAFAGLQTNFPLYSQARFGWGTVQNGSFFAYVGVCAVLIQGVLFGRIQPRLGEKKLSLLGLMLMALGLAGMAVAPSAWALYPTVGVVALGSGLSIPSLTALVSGRVPANAQGRLMGGTQTLLSLTMILGPTLAGLTFDALHITAPYWVGSGLSLLALGLAFTALRGNPPPVVGVSSET